MIMEPGGSGTGVGVGVGTELAIGGSGVPGTPTIGPGGKELPGGKSGAAGTGLEPG
ncbi:MAG TPA: hypothetical protein VGH36_01945 [Acetobacteraceae bacterium]|jgi:hypothetical protein